MCSVYICLFRCWWAWLGKYASYIIRLRNVIKTHLPVSPSTGNYQTCAQLRSERNWDVGFSRDIGDWIHPQSAICSVRNFWIVFSSSIAGPCPSPCAEGTSSGIVSILAFLSLQMFRSPYYVLLMSGQDLHCSLSCSPCPQKLQWVQKSIFTVCCLFSPLQANTVLRLLIS